MIDSFSAFLATSQINDDEEYLVGIDDDADSSFSRESSSSFSIDLTTVCVERIEKSFEESKESFEESKASLAFDLAVFAGEMELAVAVTAAAVVAAAAAAVDVATTALSFLSPISLNFELREVDREKEEPAALEEEEEEVALEEEVVVVVADPFLPSFL